MTMSPPAGMDATPSSSPRLSERENERAVDAIETAERSLPFCSCGAAMLAIEHDEALWLECATRTRRPSSVAGRVGQALTSLGHTRRLIMELSAAD